MALSIRRGVGEAVLSFLCFVAVLAALVSVDPRVSERMTTAVASGTADHQIETATKTVGSVVDVLVMAIRDQSIAHAPLLIFTIAATVLVAFMLRT